jgi:hypothetical protein
MGGGVPGPQGLYIKTRTVDWKPNSATKVIKYSEVGVISNFGQGTDDVSQVIHDNGLKLGMNFRAAHRPTVAWAGGVPNVANPQNLNYTTLTENTTITDLVQDVFGTEGRWIGYRIAPNLIPLPPPGNKTHLYFKTTIKNFRRPHNFDCHIVPIVCVLGNFNDFQTHYVLGIGIFTIGKGTALNPLALEFESQTITT